MDKIGNTLQNIQIEQLLRENRSLIKDIRSTEAKSKAKSAYLAEMSHEIRTSLNVIAGLSEVLLRDQFDLIQSKYISDIKKASESLLAVIGNILDISQIEAGKLSIFSESFNLREMLEHIRSMFDYMFSQKKLELRFYIQKNVPTMIMGDAVRLRQVLTNLLSNALKYTDEGYVEFSAWLGDDQALRFDVVDTGIGIDIGDPEKLFLPFALLEEEKHRNVFGAGLGLPISYELCRLMNGNLWYASDHGRGSTFSVRIPCTLSCVCQHPQVRTVPEYFDAENAKVLVVDDVDTNLTVAEVMLAAFHITPTLAASGSKAIELVREQDFHMILMDHTMPEMSGVEATRRIRLLGGYQNQMPVIALTANALPGTKDMFLRSGFNDYLIKPLELDALGLCLTRWLPQSVIEPSPKTERYLSRSSC